MKLLIDMNLSPQWCEVFARRGIEAVHWSAIGRADAEDAEAFVMAALEQFAPLLAEGALVVVDESRARARVLPLGGKET